MAVWLDEVDLRSVWPRDVLGHLHVQGEGFEEFRHKVAAVFKASEWAEEYDLALHVQEAGTIEEFDRVLNYAYDVADEDRVWLNTF